MCYVWVISKQNLYFNIEYHGLLDVLFDLFNKLTVVWWAKHLIWKLRLIITVREKNTFSLRELMYFRFSVSAMRCVNFNYFSVISFRLQQWFCVKALPILRDFITMAESIDYSLGFLGGKQKIILILNIWFSGVYEVVRTPFVLSSFVSRYRIYFC